MNKFVIEVYMKSGDVRRFAGEASDNAARTTLTRAAWDRATQHGAPASVMGRKVSGKKYAEALAAGAEAL